MQQVAGIRLQISAVVESASQEVHSTAGVSSQQQVIDMTSAVMEDASVYEVHSASHCCRHRHVNRTSASRHVSRKQARHFRVGYCPECLHLRIAVGAVDLLVPAAAEATLWRAPRERGVEPRRRPPQPVLACGCIENNCP